MVERISLDSHTAPFLIYVLPQFYVAKRSDLIAWYGKVQEPAWKIGDDKREGQPLIISSPMFSEIFKKV